jgi:hypothetical protein
MFKYNKLAQAEGLAKLRRAKPQSPARAKAHNREHVNRVEAGVPNSSLVSAPECCIA